MGTCDVCGIRKRYSVDNLRAKKSTACACLRKRKYSDKEGADIAGERYDAIIQRCKNEGKPVQKRYGGRGIKCLFESRQHFIETVFELIKEKYPGASRSRAEILRGLDIDRIDNDGNYEPSNLRLVERSENLKNREFTPTIEYAGKTIAAVEIWDILAHDDPDFSYSREWTYKLAKQGLSGEQILERSKKRRRGGRKPSRVDKIDSKILLKYGRKPPPLSWRRRSKSYYKKNGLT